MIRLLVELFLVYPVRGSTTSLLIGYFFNLRFVTLRQTSSFEGLEKTKESQCVFLLLLYTNLEKSKHLFTIFSLEVIGATVIQKEYSIFTKISIKKSVTQ